MSRFFVPAQNITDSTIEITDSGDLHHMRRVLRIKPGDEIDVSDMERFEYRGRVESITEDGALLRILDKQSFAAEPKTRITLYQGIPKQAKMESIIQKSVELGVDEIVPVFMDRTVVVDKGNFTRKVDRWQKVSAEAVKQCKRGMIPEVRNPIRMHEVVEELSGYDLVIIPYEDEEKTTIKQVLRDFNPHVAGRDDAPLRNADNHGEPAGSSVALIIGPEGGFSKDEVTKVTESGGRSASLGKTTLRTETAGPAAIAMIMYELELCSDERTQP